jgi:hypothetical protein
VPRLCELYLDICLTTEEKARKNFSQGSQRLSAVTTKTEYTEQNIRGLKIKFANSILEGLFIMNLYQVENSQPSLLFGGTEKLRES